MVQMLCLLVLLCSASSVYSMELVEKFAPYHPVFKIMHDTNQDWQKIERKEAEEQQKRNESWQKGQDLAIRIFAVHPNLEIYNKVKGNYNIPEKDSLFYVKHMIERVSKLSTLDRAVVWQSLMSGAMTKEFLFSSENQIGKVPQPSDVLQSLPSFYQEGLNMLEKNMQTRVAKICEEKLVITKDGIDLPMLD